MTKPAGVSSTCEAPFPYGGLGTLAPITDVEKHDDGFIVTRTWKDAGLMSLELKNREGVLHSLTSPAIVVYAPSEERYARMACTSAKTVEVWYRDGKIHRDNAPAVTCYTNQGVPRLREWWTDGEFIDRKNGQKGLKTYE
ncbi:hypothetical protein R6G85_02540 [Actinotignum urinale]|uniref:hypothetical protein n=1 Tax=Actinotignum urinale TaxID=190146 RepID=UPI002A821A9B|nr:hypothetical protein [Actinotignum urinale]MDY5151366.1 hypothetical protein [Actinotignum urinale]